MKRAQQFGVGRAAPHAPGSRATAEPEQARTGGGPSAGPSRPAFSLIELMVAVGLLSLIVLGLLQAFNQTQKAFRTGINQGDVMEAGRATMDMMARELSQMTPSGAPDTLINGYRYRATNFFSEPSPFFIGAAGYTPLEQGLPSMPNNVLRTNTIQRFFFLTRLNQDWLGTGYEVLPDDPSNPMVGTLYRFASTARYLGRANDPSARFRNEARKAFLQSAAGLPVTNLNRIADGIVHLRVRAYAHNGFLMVTNRFLGTNAYFRSFPFSGPVNNANLYTNAWNAIACANDLIPDQSATYFMSNAVPAYVDIEFGILEPQVLQRYRSIPLGPAQRQYLSNHVAQVQLFHQRIAIPNVDTTAYP